MRFFERVRDHPVAASAFHAEFFLPKSNSFFVVEVDDFWIDFHSSFHHIVDCCKFRGRGRSRPSMFWNFRVFDGFPLFDARFYVESKTSRPEFFAADIAVESWGSV